MEAKPKAEPFPQIKKKMCRLKPCLWYDLHFFHFSGKERSCQMENAPRGSPAVAKRRIPLVRYAAGGETRKAGKGYPGGTGVFPGVTGTAMCSEKTLKEIENCKKRDKTAEVYHILSCIC